VDRDKLAHQEFNQQFWMNLLKVLDTDGDGNVTFDEVHA